jgi:hypothetical protein
MKKKTISLLVCWSLIVTVGSVHANLIINGDFEDNTAVSTTYNMSNTTFNSTVANATAFGTSEEIDLVTGSDFGIEPQSGNWKLGLHQRTNGPTKVDAFSLNLSSPVVTGNSYSLQFFAAGLSNEPLGPVQIGLSNSATNFGTLIFSGTPAGTNSWTQFDHDFVAPVNALYLTVRNTTIDDMFAFVDNFTLVPEPTTVALLTLGALTALRRRKKR